MMKNLLFIMTVFFIITSLNASKLHAQDSVQACRVVPTDLIGTYNGECKQGFANGKGEAKGFHHYVGIFKDGLPNGKGIYYYSDSIYYSGNFQDGLKEGKGEMHYLKNEHSDSIVKGYWSADEYRGKRYATYKFNGAALFDQFEISPSDESGNTITIEISTTSGSPNGSPTSAYGGTGYVLTLKDLIAMDGSFIRKTSTYSSVTKFYATYELSKFPVRLYATLSNGRTFELELYKSSTWRVRLYVNK